MKVKKILIYAGIIVFLLFIDQISKYLTFKYLGNVKSMADYSFYLKGGVTNVDCIPHLIDFRLLTNDGAMFGFLSGKKVLFIIVTIIGLGLFGYMLKSGDIIKYPFYTIGLLLCFSGALGNFIDRIIIGQVRDFITFGFMNFASFNFADMCMCVGIGMIFIDVLFGDVTEIWK